MSLIISINAFLEITFVCMLPIGVFKSPCLVICLRNKLSEFVVSISFGIFFLLVSPSDVWILLAVLIILLVIFWFSSFNLVFISFWVELSKVSLLTVSFRFLISSFFELSSLAKSPILVLRFLIFSLYSAFLPTRSLIHCHF